MRIVYVSDLHGLVGLYRRLAEHCRRVRPDLLLIGGDLFPDGRRPHPHLDQIRFVQDFLSPWLSALRNELPDLRIVAVPGNHDWIAATGRVREICGAAAPELLLSPDRPVDVRGVPVTGYANVPMSAFWVKDFERFDLPEDVARGCPGRCFVTRGTTVEEVDPVPHFAALPTIRDELAALPDGRHAEGIFLCHCPPAETFADLMYGPVHIGSRGIRAFIDRCRPKVSLHGHIHEAPAMSGLFADQVGDTLVVNPGRIADQLEAVFFDWEDPLRSMRHTRLGMVG